MKGKEQNGLSNTTERCIVDVEVRHHAMYSLEITAYGSLRVRRYDCVRHLLTAGLQVSAAVLGLLELWEIGAKPSLLLCNT